MNVHLVRANFLLALMGTFGSLYFSEVMGLPPCPLCWYQRIFLYPLVFIFAAALWRGDRNYRIYALPLTFAGLAIAIYHNLLYFGFISEALAPCTKELSCSSRQLELFGFVTIPLMSLAGFFVIALLIFIDKKLETTYEK
jgi:disulfide bond formation protein DsbB